MEKFNFKKSLGQNFIKDENIIDKIVAVADIDKNTLVIEIGPGAGALSLKLVSQAKYAVLYEIDTRLETVLRNKLSSYNNYDLIMKDFLSVSICEDISKYDYDKIVVVANIPYYITTPIITKLINEVSPDRIVIMIQDEVANRLAAKAGTSDYGYMSVVVQSKYNVIKEFLVDKQYFTPVPKVDSAVIRMDSRDDIYIKDYEIFIKLLKDSFRYKRKNIKNNLNKYNLNEINTILNKYNLSIMNRSEDVPVTVFADIANNLLK